MNIIPHLNVEAGIRINKLEGENFSLKSVCFILLIAFVILAASFAGYVVWTMVKQKDQQKNFKDLKEIKTKIDILFEKSMTDKNQGLTESQLKLARRTILIC